MTLKKTPPAERCDFPTWFKGPKHWRSLTSSTTYSHHQKYWFQMKIFTHQNEFYITKKISLFLFFLILFSISGIGFRFRLLFLIFFFAWKIYSEGSLHIMKSNNHLETRALCEQINKQTSTETELVVHQTSGWWVELKELLVTIFFYIRLANEWKQEKKLIFFSSPPFLLLFSQSGFMCMRFYKRDSHIAEIQMGQPTESLEDACLDDYFDVNRLPYITLMGNVYAIQSMKWR